MSANIIKLVTLNGQVITISHRSLDAMEIAKSFDESMLKGCMWVPSGFKE